MEIKGFRGLRNTTSPERFRTGELATAVDVDIDDTQKIMSRRGRLIMNSTASHSLYSYGAYSYVVQNSVLKGVNPDLTCDTIKQLTTNDYTSYASLDGVTYYSNGTDIGKLRGRQQSNLGVTPPIGQPTAARVVGSLPAGRYLYALTFLRSDGHESGTGLSGSIDLIDNSGISFSSIEVSTNPEVIYKVLYISGTNGEVMYRSGVMANSTTGVNYTSNGLDLTIPLMTQFAEPPPAGSIIHIYNGVLYVVVGDTIFYSDSYQFERFRFDTSYIRLPGQIAMLTSVNDGIYVATADIDDEVGETYFLAGNRPDQFQPTTVFDYGAYYGGGKQTNAAFFETAEQAVAEGDLPKIAAVWAGRRGICIGYDGGTVKNLTEAKFSFPSAQRASGVVREFRGMAQYVVTLQGVGAANNIFVEEV